MKRSLLAATTFAAAFAFGLTPGADGTLEIGSSSAHAQGNGGGNGGGQGGGPGGGGPGGSGGGHGGPGGSDGPGDSDAGPRTSDAAAAGGFGRGGVAAGFGAGDDDRGFGRGLGLGRTGEIDDRPDRGFGVANRDDRDFGVEDDDFDDEDLGFREDDFGDEDFDDNVEKSVASELKGYNAAHASERARDVAAPNSMVGQVEAYAEMDEVDRDSLENDLGFSDDAVRDLRGLLGLAPDDDVIE